MNFPKAVITAAILISPAFACIHADEGDKPYSTFPVLEAAARLLPPYNEAGQRSAFDEVDQKNVIESSGIQDGRVAADKVADFADSLEEPADLIRIFADGYPDGNMSMVTIDSGQYPRLLDRGVKSINYMINPDGTYSIDTVIMADGTSLRYSEPGLDENGNVVSLPVSAGDIRLTFYDEERYDYEMLFYGHNADDVAFSSKPELNEDSADPGGRRAPIMIILRKPAVGTSSGPDGEQGGKPASPESPGFPGAVEPARGHPAVEIYYPVSGEGLDRIRKTPVKFDFKEIGKAVKKLSKMGSDAKRSYNAGTEEYYIGMETVLRNNMMTLEAEGVIVRALPEADAEGVSGRREYIDKAVSEIYEYSKRGGSKGTIAELLAIERGLRESVIDPEMEIYEGRVQAAMEYADAIIDKLVSSQLALYLKSKKGRVEVIINLPKQAAK